MLPEASSAQTADVRRDAFVHVPHMHSQRPLLGECLRTQTTEVRPQSVVPRAHVPREGPLLRKACAAVRTGALEALRGGRLRDGLHEASVAGNRLGRAVEKMRRGDRCERWKGDERKTASGRSMPTAVSGRVGLGGRVTLSVESVDCVPRERVSGQREKRRPVETSLRQ